jgi:hypothetical protein
MIYTLPRAKVFPLRTARGLGQRDTGNGNGIIHLIPLATQVTPEARGNVAVHLSRGNEIATQVVLDLNMGPVDNEPYDAGCLEVLGQVLDQPEDPGVWFVCHV